MQTLWEYVHDGTLPDTIHHSPTMIKTVLTTLKNAKRPLTAKEISELTGYSTSSFTNRLFQLQKHVGAVRVAQKYDGRTRELDEVQTYSSVKKWLGQLKEGPSRKNAMYVFSHFADYLKVNTKFKDPDSLIEDALDGNRRNLLKHIEIAKSFALSLTDGLDGTRSKRYETVRSFYANNDCELPKSKLKFVHVEETDLDLKQAESFKFIEMVRKAVNQSKISVIERAIVLIQYQSGMDDSTLSNVFNYLAYYQLCQHFGSENWRNWDSSKVPVLIHLRRPKTGVKFYTFLDKDAIDCLKDWLEVRFNLTHREIKIHPSKRGDKLPLSDPIFIVGDGRISEGGKGIKAYYPSNVFRDVGFKAGINEKPAEQTERYKGARIRYLFHAHECRDSLVSLSEVKSNVVCGQFITAHKIDKYSYNKSPWKDELHFKELYSRMSPWLNVISVDPEKLTLQNELTVTKEAKSRIDNELFIANKRLEDKNLASDSRIKSLEENMAKLLEAVGMLHGPQKTIEDIYGEKKIENLNEVMSAAQAKEDQRVESRIDEETERKVEARLKARADQEARQRDKESLKGKGSLTKIYATEK